MAISMTDRPDRYAESTPWHLQANNAPVVDEITATDLEVRGALPPELNGRYFRNGANPQTGYSEHWFIGDGMVHGIELSGGRATWYRNRYVHTPMYANPGADRTELSLDPETLQMDLRVSAANTHVIGHAGRILALEEGAFPYELTPQAETIGAFDFDGKLTTAMTAHPKMCPETGELLFFGYGVISPPFFTYHRANAAGELVQSTPVEMGGPTMIHDFAVSRNHIVVMDLPMVFDLELAMQGGMPIRWSDEYPARMGVMAREGSSDVQWFDIDPCYVFHTLNAHDDGETVVMRGCRIERLWVDSADMGEGGEAADDGPQFWEWTFDLADGTVSDRQLDDDPCEFPRVADADAGFDARYGYTMAMRGEGPGAVFKYDLADGMSKQVHEFGAGRTPGEPVFAPAADASSPDDGYLMTFVYDEATDTSSFVVLDATDVAADPVAEVPLPVRVPTGFHGSWISDS